MAVIVILLGSIGLLFIQKEQDEKIIKKDNITLKELNLTKDMFFSIIAHDLRGPIGALTNLGQFLSENDDEMDSNQRKQLLNAIYNSSKNTYNLLENLLQWASSESGKLVVSPVTINLKEIVDSSVKLMQENIKSKNISIQVNINDGDVAFADYNMILTVVRNLLSNAIKFTPDKGKIFINTFKTNNDFIKLSIEDTGVGIVKKHLKNLFEISSKIKTKGTNNESGTGLGLKLCKEFKGN